MSCNRKGPLGPFLMLVACWNPSGEANHPQESGENRLSGGVNEDAIDIIDGHVALVTTFGALPLAGGPLLFSKTPLTGDT